ncbi:WGR domain-containing protein, predicted DNA-binding domain in MolR [Micromonospora purpureochromogenes]|uniref:WGR domain-containing protein, predicted DNA-binding domain in MolR n=1 Tax=Micromonospora purpureochromogenes TaxID=47872 RepID=A0A1C4XSY2_9ACTN|nr:PQQ-binding-like beta-propeller repeat protein [Micromonospora purpureochromogenes]SCF11492.1 WGR domain-containing protein, predicted DNA-binding domain in MolR [Micromonospora purpureochromogenes]
MSQETTYLELSEVDGAHKFYEVVVEDATLTVRYGRIGDQGQVKASAYPDNARARAAAAKKIGEKVRKGYAPAVPGVRKKRSVSRRQIVSTRSTARTAPVLWRYDSGAPAFGIFVDGQHCMVGNEHGVITTLGHDAQVRSQVRLPDGVKCIVADDAWIYAGCDDGNVYDLSGKVPRVAYAIAPEIDIYWLDIHDGVLGVSDADGGIAAIDHEDEFLWRRPGRGRSAWMVRCDTDALYHGHSQGVTGFDWRTGRELWHTSTGSVLFGWQERGSVFAGTSTREVVRLAKNGRVERRYRCDAPVFSCATAEGGRYVFAGDSQSSIYCFDATGTRLWKLGTGCGSAYSMQYHDERLYVVTTGGHLACIDASEPAIRAAQVGDVPQVLDVKAPRQAPRTVEPTVVEVTSDAGAGVVVQCLDDRGRLRVQVVSDGYRRDWSVQFPKGIREPGARYLVTEVRESGRGGFYRAYGDIRRLR